MGAHELVEGAFEELARLPGYVERPDQRQLAHLISDCIEAGSSGAFEAPTGLGKSLAALIPAIAHAMGSGKRTVIATYTNVLAEQYRNHDLPLALSLFDQEHPKTAFLIGRQRYACIAQMEDVKDSREFRLQADLGIESEFQRCSPFGQREMIQIWRSIAAPPVCPGRLCPHYHDCYYYKARREAERALVVLTNHSVVLQDALLRKVSEGELNLLGDVDFVIFDEAHDLPQAAHNAFEFELSESKLRLLNGLAGKIHASLVPLAERAGAMEGWNRTLDVFRQEIEKLSREITAYGLTHGPGILTATPPDLLAHPQVARSKAGSGIPQAAEIAARSAENCMSFIEIAVDLLKEYKQRGETEEKVAEQASEAVHNYTMFLREFAHGCGGLVPLDPAEDDSPLPGCSVSYCSETLNGAILRRDIIDLAAPLRELVWEQVPAVCMSATLALDGNFDFFHRLTGAEPQFEDVLPSPFDHSSQCSIYLPPPGKVPDPSEARKSGQEQVYYLALARELSSIIQAVRGRTLALFHSRREMEAVHALMELPPELPIHVQRRSGAASTGELFKLEIGSSLFALRSFWTGFDAPGETLQCVALVRVPFEVPVDPPQIARMAWLQGQGMNPFFEHSLPQAKMLMRQGAGRLIRRSEDRGVIALLDPRLQLKNYGESILANLPPGIRQFSDIEEAVAWVGLVAEVC